MLNVVVILLIVINVLKKKMEKIKYVMNAKLIINFMMVNVKNLMIVRKIKKIVQNVLEKKEMVNVLPVTRHIMFQMERNVLKLIRFHAQQIKIIVKHVIQMDI